MNSVKIYITSIIYIYLCVANIKGIIFYLDRYLLNKYILSNFFLNICWM